MIRSQQGRLEPRDEEEQHMTLSPETNCQIKQLHWSMSRHRCSETQIKKMHWSVLQTRCESWSRTLFSIVANGSVISSGFAPSSMLVFSHALL